MYTIIVSHIMQYINNSTDDSDEEGDVEKIISSQLSSIWVEDRQDLTHEAMDLGNNSVETSEGSTQSIESNRKSGGDNAQSIEDNKDYRELLIKKVSDFAMLLQNVQNLVREFYVKNALFVKSREFRLIEHGSGPIQISIGVCVRKRNCELFC